MLVAPSCNPAIVRWRFRTLPERVVLDLRPGFRVASSYFQTDAGGPQETPYLGRQGCDFLAFDTGGQNGRGAAAKSAQMRENRVATGDHRALRGAINQSVGEH